MPRFAQPLSGLSLLIAVNLVAYAEDSSSLGDAMRALYRGEPHVAATLSRKYVDAHPRESAGRMLLARAEIVLRNLDSAFRELQEVLRLEPDNIDALYYWGRLCQLLSQAEYRKLYAIAPDSYRVHQILAESYQLQNDDAKAEQEYQQALKLKPESVEILDALGNLKRQQADYAKALSYYSKAAEISPRDYDSVYGIGACHLLGDGDAERAVPHFRLAVSIDSHSAAARFALGSALLKASRPAEALAELKSATVLEPAMRQAWVLLGRAYQQLKQPHEAEQAYQRVRQLAEQGSKP